MAESKTLVETSRYIFVTYGDLAEPNAYELVRKADGAALNINEDDIEAAKAELASLEFAFPTNPLDWRLEQLFRSYWVDPAEIERSKRRLEQQRPA